MSNNIWFISDTHFGHTNAIFKFKRADGTPLRDFKDESHMNEYMVEKWNSVVKENDKVYHLGDVVINKKYLHILGRLNGSKRLIRGNHDIFPTKVYMEYFKEIYGVRVLDDMVLSHIPLNRECITTRFETNVHGHLHSNDIEDGAYYNVSCEQLDDYAPIALEDLRLKIKAKKKKYAKYNSNGRLRDATTSAT